VVNDGVGTTALRMAALRMAALRMAARVTTGWGCRQCAD